MSEQKKDLDRELWKVVATVIWFIFGLAAPAPLLPYALYPQMGMLWGIIFGVIATILWLLPAYLVIVKSK